MTTRASAAPPAASAIDSALMALSDLTESQVSGLSRAAFPEPARGKRSPPGESSETAPSSSYESAESASRAATSLAELQALSSQLVEDREQLAVPPVRYAGQRKVKAVGGG